MVQRKLLRKMTTAGLIPFDFRLFFRLVLVPLIAAVFLSLSPVGQKSAEAVPLDGVWRYYDGISPASPRAVPDWLSKTIRQGFSGWIIYDGKSHPDIDSKAADIWVTTYVPPHYYIQPSLYFVTSNQAVEVYYDSHIIYHSGITNDENRGTRWHLIDLPRDSSGRSLSFHLYSPFNNQLGVILSPNVGNAIEQVFTIIWGDLFCLLALPLSLFIIVLVGIYYLTHRNIVYIYTIIFMVLYSVWLLATSNIRQLFLDSPVFWRTLQLLSIYLLCPLGNLVAREFMPFRDRKPFTCLIYTYVGLAAAAMIGEALGFGSLESGISLCYILMGTAQLYIAYIIIRAAWHGHASSRAILPAMIATPLLALLDGLTLHYHILPFFFYWLPLSIIFILYYIIRILQENFAAEQLLSNKNRELAHKAQIDGLTKCFNRSALKEALIRATQICRHNESPLCVLMLDIDFFKRINDEFGHAAGDAVLVNFAGAIRQLLDSRHTFIRYGGEEFVILCCDFTLPQAEELAHSILLAVANGSLLPEHPITTSIGISVWRGPSDLNLIKRADEALYDAKASGRNCYRVEAE